MSVIFKFATQRQVFCVRR